MSDEYIQRELDRIRALREQVHQFSIPPTRIFFLVIFNFAIGFTLIWNDLAIFLIIQAGITVTDVLQLQISILRNQSKVLVTILESSIEEKLKLELPISTNAESN